MRITPHRLNGVFETREGRKSALFTKGLVPTRFADQRIIRQEGVDYREWDPGRSKLAAAIKKGLQQMGISQGKSVLYLGASHGYTPSFVSDIVREDGFVFCLDFAPRVVKDLVFICESRSNMAPIMADAKKTEEYAKWLGDDKVDVVYQDIAQRGQADIFIKNCDRFLKKGGYGLLALKARSEDVTKRPVDIFKRIKKRFEGELSSQYLIVDYRELDPFEKDHAFFVVKRR